MYRRLMFVFITLVIFSLMTAPMGSANAQNPLSPPSKSSLTAGSNAPVSTGALTLGSPGLSFRYVQTIGTTNEPYQIDNDHLNNPTGLTVGSSDSLYVAENLASRVQKYDSTGAVIQSLGHAGQPWSHDDFLSQVRDTAVNTGNDHVWVAMSPAIKEFDENGVLVQTFPATNPWESGADNDHFSYSVTGISYGPDGYLYVVDQQNHRIQVYDVSGATPSYITTIGTTGTPQSNNTGFDQPTQIVFDSTDRLYVADAQNYRIQRCTSSSPWTTWTCSTFFGGTPGSDLSHIDWSDGIGIDSSDNLFIADGNNSRVLKCDTSAATCSLFAGVTGVGGSDSSHFSYVSDVAIDSAGKVYVSDSGNYRVQKFDSGGTYESTLGTAGDPYQTDSSHLNQPWGISQAADGGYYVTERAGFRLIKMSAAGVQQWTVGEEGVWGSDNTHFGSWWAGLEGSPAVDASGRVYVGDTGNNRVQIFNSNGSYNSTLGSYGTGNYEFSCPSEIAINPSNGDVYVTDKCNYRIQVFTSTLVYKATLGATGTSGSDNLHFNSPFGVAVDASGNIYVADSDNHRIQKCILIGVAPGYSCSTFLGVTGDSANDFAHFSHPLSVKFDGSGRFYVIDEWNSRVQVFDASGAYLTTIPGMNGPSGVAVDSSGNVYVTDRENHRIQKYAPGVPGWQQKNINGFGDINNYSVDSLEAFNGQLYAGATNYNEGATIWRTSNGSTWTSVSVPGFGATPANTNSVLFDMIEFNGYLYAGTGQWTPDGVPGQVWRSSNGTTWQLVDGTGFGNSNNDGIFNFAIFNNKLYASTINSTNGVEVWRSATGNSGDWQSVATAGFGISPDYAMSDNLTVFNGYLYAGIEPWVPAGTAQIWRTNDGTTWNPVNADGFGDSHNHSLSGFAALGGYLYVGTHNTTTGAQMYRSNNGTTWTQVIGNGFGDLNNFKIESMFAYHGNLYAGTDNGVTGGEVWRSANGTSWSQINPDGFGDSNNTGISLLSNALAEFQNGLYIGTPNGANGGEVWGNTPVFTDVTFSYWANSYIERLYSKGITGGCSVSPLNYCPENLVTRDQMAIFLERGIRGSSFSPPNVSPTFGDTAGNFAEDWIEVLKNDGITGGCGNGNYCPTSGVTRAQMAIFLERAMHGSSFVPPNVAPTFGDTVGNFAEDWIEALKNDGITSGCGNGNYCPDDIVTRAQMAVFLAKAFNLP